MNHDPSSLPEPEPPRDGLESLERQLRALPAPPVPSTLHSRLIAALPPTQAAAGAAAGIWKLWPWVAAIGGAAVVAAALTYTWLANRNPRAAPPANAERSATGDSASGPNAPSTKAVRDAEQAVRIDPYNADAWFALAKAQAEAHQSAEAVSSAEKALDVARSRDRTDLAQTVEAWLRSHRKTGGNR